MDRFQKQWIRREFNKTNGMIFLYKILFSQLTIWFYICAFSGSCYGRLCYDLYASLLRICCSADRGIHFPRCCFKDIGAFRQVVRPSGVLTCLCPDARKLRTDPIRNGCRTHPWLYCHGIFHLVQSPSAYFKQPDPGRYAALACRTDAAKQWKYPVQCDH